jgi:hypothetical protein
MFIYFIFIFIFIEENTDIKIPAFKIKNSELYFYKSTLKSLLYTSQLHMLLAWNAGHERNIAT